MKASPCVGLFCEVNMRNDLLADIVTALGGTVTDRNNRSLLLNDWLTAVKTPAIEYVAQLDGATQSWILTDPITIPANTDFEIGLCAVRSSEDWGCLVGGMNTILSAWSSGSYALGATLDRSVSFSTATNSWPNDNTERKAVFKRVSGVAYLELDGVQGTNTEPFSSALSIISLGKDEKGSFADFLTGYIRDFYVKINGTLTNQIPLTNKFQGATQLATVGNVNATMVNYTEAVWRKP